MHIFLIDLENVHSGGLEGIERLSSCDKVIVFYSNHVKVLSIPVVELIRFSKGEISFIKIKSTGENALDFQLATMLGALSQKNKNGEYIIISKDKGFQYSLDFCRDYFKDYDLHYAQYPTIKEFYYKDVLSNISTKNDNNEFQDTKNLILTAEYEYIYKRLLPTVQKATLDTYVAEIDMAVRNSHNKNEFYQYLRSVFGTAKGCEVYHLAKDEFESLKVMSEKVYKILDTVS